MTREIMDSVLTKINRKMAAAKRNILLFMDNAPCHLENFVVPYWNTKVVFLPKNFTSRLQPVDAGIIRNCRIKHRKKLLKFVISQIDDNRKTSKIIQEADVLKEISWIKAAWEEVSGQAATNCFRKCSFRNKAEDWDLQTLHQDEGEESANLVKELDGGFDKDLASSIPAVNAGSISWRQGIRKENIEKHKN